MPDKRRHVAKKKPKPRAGLERPFCDGEWTRARYFGFIRSALRQASSRWKPIYSCLKDAEVGKCINKSSGRLAMHYQCAKCYLDYPRKQVQVDHIIEAGSLNCYEDLPGFVERLLCDSQHLRVLCLTCHHKVTHQSS